MFPLAWCVCVCGPPTDAPVDPGTPSGGDGGGMPAAAAAPRDRRQIATTETTSWGSWKLEGNVLTFGLVIFVGVCVLWIYSEIDTKNRVLMYKIF